MSVKIRINRKFALKYAAFWISVITFLFALFFPVLQMRLKQENVVISLMVVVTVFIIMNCSYWKYDVRKGIDKREFIIGYLEYFKDDNFNKFKYIESLRWFSKSIHEIYLCKSEENQGVLNLVNLLHRVVKPKKHNFCTATHQRYEFRKLCEKILKNPNKESFDDEQELVNKIEKGNINSLTTFEFIKCMLFETPFIYFLQLILTTVGCVFLAAGNKNQFIGNILIAIPSNVMLILGYFNILKDKYNQ